MLLFISGLFMGGFIGISIMSLITIDRYEEIFDESKIVKKEGIQVYDE